MNTLAEDPLGYIPSSSNSDAIFHFQLFNAMQIALFLGGCMVVLYYLLQVIDMMCDLLVRKSIPISSFGVNDNCWAVVTGCTDGIGKELALQLGEAGYNLVLLSRTQEKLDKVEQQLAQMGVKVDSFAVDFGKTTTADWEHIKEMVVTKKIGVLVNNVGMCHASVTKFMDESPDVCRQMVDINVTTMMNLTRFVLPQMRARKNGLVLNIGSWTSLMGMPFLSVYAGTKAFVKTFSQSLGIELEHEGVRVEHIVSFWVRSKMSGYKTSSLSVPSPRVYAQHVLSHIGLRCGTTEPFSSIPYMQHSFMGFVVSVMWDLKIAPPTLYSVANNLYKLALKKRRLKQ